MIRRRHEESCTGRMLLYQLSFCFIYLTIHGRFSQNQSCVLCSALLVPTTPPPFQQHQLNSTSPPPQGLSSRTAASLHAHRTVTRHLDLTHLLPWLPRRLQRLRFTPRHRKPQHPALGTKWFKRRMCVVAARSLRNSTNVVTMLPAWANERGL